METPRVDDDTRVESGNRWGVGEERICERGDTRAQSRMMAL